MKRILCLFLASLILITASITAFAKPDNVEEYIFVVFNDEEVEFDKEKPFTKDGYTYVPDYSIFKVLGLKIAWDDSKKTLHITRGDKKVSAKEKDKLLSLPKSEMKMKYYRTNDVLMLPLEPIADAFSFGVSFIPDAKIIRITNGKNKLHDSEIKEKYKDKIKKEKDKLKKEKQETILAGAKVVYLTFDDGPSPKNTPVILDILKKYNAKATFFMLEGNMKKYPDIVKRIKKEGHALGLHGVTHVKSMFYKNAWSPAKEMQQANQTLKSITGEGTCLVRVPYGSAPNLSNQQYKNLRGAGYRMWDWNIDSEDSLSANVSSSTIYNNAIKGLKGKNNPVMLFHDKSNVRYCLDNLLSYLTKNGYHIVPIMHNTKMYNWKEK
ncbi:MAG: polysaccharide deacetylase family protein [Clostridia bacterium]|nr:polysaccharide deacetylase family protein [Clostridia bacterium]